MTKRPRTSRLRLRFETNVVAPYLRLELMIRRVRPRTRRDRVMRLYLVWLQ